MQTEAALAVNANDALRFAATARQISARMLSDLHKFAIDQHVDEDRLPAFARR